MPRSHEPLADPEPGWERAAAIDSIELAEIEARLGQFEGPVSVLSGGQANLNVLLGSEQVLRIYRRDQSALSKEAALLQKEWRAFQVPRVLREGEDFLLLEYVEHHKLSGSALHGRKVGAALAEIHSRAFAQSGLLSPELLLKEPFVDFVDALRSHAESQVPKPLRCALGIFDRAFAFLEQQAPAMRALAGQPVLLHGDFKPANLHESASGRLLILDWEFAYAGPAWMDVGQLMRWHPPGSFREAFAEAYVQGGRSLPSRWEQVANLFDLFNLLSLLGRAQPGSQRAQDLLARVEQTVSARERA